MFDRYQHIERFGNDEVQGIELGECYIFPKLDGTNASIWMNDHEEICTGSRNRELSLENDNAGFHAATLGDDALVDCMQQNPSLRLFGEWLVPHSLKTYRESAWRNFYVFDVYCRESERYMAFDEYSDILSKFDIEVIQPVSIIKNASYEQLLTQMERNTFLIEDGKGSGEGIVIKNYAFENKYGRSIWAKMVTTEFKDKHVKEMGPSIIAGTKMVEDAIVDEYVSSHLIEKTFDKIRVANDGFNSRNIPELLNRVYHDMVSEEIWSFVKKFKNPTINFKTLHTLTIRKIKVLKPELF